MFRAMERTNEPLTKGEKTQRRLVEAGFELFGQDGYNGVAAEAIVERAGVTRGALYHHFTGKQQLFEAVLVHCQMLISDQIMSAATAHVDPIDRLIHGSVGSLDALADDGLRRILIEDGPSVLGWSRWRAIDAEHGCALLRDSIQSLTDAGLIVGYSSDTLACVISGAINDLAAWISASDDPDAAYVSARKTLGTILRKILK
jgi:AcrR family transcriptional regulator